jgi:hypothetical protein
VPFGLTIRRKYPLDVGYVGCGYEKTHVMTGCFGLAGRFAGIRIQLCRSFRWTAWTAVLAADLDLVPAMFCNFPFGTFLAAHTLRFLPIYSVRGNASSSNFITMLKSLLQAIYSRLEKGMDERGPEAS